MTKGKRCLCVAAKAEEESAMCHMVSLLLLTFLSSHQFLSLFSSSSSFSSSSLVCASAVPPLYSSFHSASASSDSGGDEDSLKLTGLFFGKRNLNPNINHLLFGRRSDTDQNAMQAARTLMKGDQSDEGVEDKRVGNRGRSILIRWPMDQLPHQSIR